MKKAVLLCTVLFALACISLAQIPATIAAPDYILDPAKALPRVGIYAASSNPAYNEDVRAKIAAMTTVIGSVDLHDASVATPTLDELLQYDSVLVFSDICFQDYNAMGDVLYDYALVGGGVVVAGSAFTECYVPYLSNATCDPATACIGLGGRYALWDRNITNSSPQQLADEIGGVRLLPIANTLDALPNTAGYSLGKVLAQHPVLKSVDTFTAGTNTGARPVAIFGRAISSQPPQFYDIIGVWSEVAGIPMKNGSIYLPALVAEKETSRRVLGKLMLLNFHPASSDVKPDGWIASTNGAQLMANTLSYAARTNYCSIASTPRIGIFSDYDGAFLVDLVDKLSVYMPTGACIAAHRLNLDTVSFSEPWPQGNFTAVPSAADLKASYDAVFVWMGGTDGAFLAAGENGQRFADQLGQYSDLGGGVVLTAYSFAQNVTSPNAIGILTGNYAVFGTLQSVTEIYPFSVESITSCHQAGLNMTKNVPEHPIVGSVEYFNGGALSARNVNITLATGALLVASWSDGTPMVSVRQNAAGAGIIGLNMYPASSDVDLGKFAGTSIFTDRCRDDWDFPAFWDASTRAADGFWDVARLMAQAIRFSIPAAAPPPPPPARR